MKNIIYPKQVQIFISEVCSEGCRYCPYTAIPLKERIKLLKKELSINQWRQVVHYFYSKMGVRFFTLIGGEPAAKKNVDKLVEYINKKLPGSQILFATSGLPLLSNKSLLEKLIKAGARNFLVSVDGIRTKPNLNINIKKELSNLRSGLKKGSQRKSLLGLYFLFLLRKKYPKIKFRLGANCIINKETIKLIIPTYNYFKKHNFYLNLCMEQTLCFEGKSKTVFTKKDKQLLTRLTTKLIKIKKTADNFLIPSLEYLKSIPSVGLNQSYKCSASLFPSTINITSDGQLPFCIWHKGSLEKHRFNITAIIKEKKRYEDWLKLWQEDKNGQKCSCSWSFPDRVGDYRQKLYNNSWYQFL